MYQVEKQAHITFWFWYSTLMLRSFCAIDLALLNFLNYYGK